MNVRKLYGSHPERLSDLLDSLAPADRSKVQLLSFEENAEFASSSIDKLPQTNWGTIDWAAAPHLEQQEAVQEPEAAAAIRDAISAKSAPESTVIIFWGNLVVPAVRTTTSIAVNAMDEILATSHDVWIYLPAENILIEHFHEGRVTVAEL